MIYITKNLLDEMIGHSKNEFPNEACGILAGKNNRVSKVYTMSNVEQSPARYFMSGQEQFKAMKEMRNLGLEMVGIYHSHIESQAYPSAHDVEMAFYPDASYLIVSLKDKKNPIVRSFKINEGKISEEEIKIE